MSIRIHALPIAEMGIPASSVLHNTGTYAPELKNIPNVKMVEWSDGTVSEGVKQCGCVFYIEGAEQKIIVDTGVGDFEKIKKFRDAKGDKYHLRALKPLEQQLAALGVRPEEIDVVINTHLHWDHVGGNMLFTNARFYIPFADMPYALTTPKWAPHFFNVSRDNVIGICDRASFVKRTLKVCDGVAIHHLGGHTEGSQGVFVKTAKGVAALGGDVVSKYANVEENWPGPGGNFWDISELMEAFAFLRSEADIIIPCHDWLLFDRFKDGIIG